VPSTRREESVSRRAARVLVLFTPGNIEGFFDYGESKNGSAPSEAKLMEGTVLLGPKYWLEVLGPSPL
jgi:hypothetical protein